MNCTTGMIYKQCTICREEKPATAEYFYRQKDGKYGLKGMCKICKGEKDRQYTNDNKEELIRKWRAYNDKNRERINGRNKEWYWSNVEEIKERRKTMRKNNPRVKKDSDAVAMRKYYIKNQDRLRERARNYRRTEKGREIERLAGQRRRARAEKLPSTFTLEQWEECKIYFNYSCCYCGKKEKILHQEHFHPLSKGGGYTKENIVPSCKHCNHRKHASLFREWYPSFEFYDKKREEKIIDYLGYNDNHS